MFYRMGLLGAIEGRDMTKSHNMKDPTAAASEMMDTFVQMAGGDHDQARQYAAAQAAQMQQSQDPSEQQVGAKLATLSTGPA